MSTGGIWPGGARGALTLTFDNLGGEQADAAPSLPPVLGALAESGLHATFFVEGVNAELRPEALRAIAAADHEVGFHAWRHETWAELSAGEAAANLRRGVDAFESLGLDVRGMRPPGGGLGPAGTAVLREGGLRYCSPAGGGAGVEDGLALLPFEWRHVDASCVLPPLGAVREQIAGSSEPVGPDAFLAHLDEEVDRLAEEGGYLAFVLHLFMLDWLGEARLERLLARVADNAAGGRLWVGRCDEVADHVLATPSAFEGGTVLDPTSWN